MKDQQVFILGEKRTDNRVNRQYVYIDDFDAFHQPKKLPVKCCALPYPKDFYHSCTSLWSNLIANVHEDQWDAPREAMKCTHWAQMLQAVEDLGIKWWEGHGFNVNGYRNGYWVGIYIEESRMEELREELNRRFDWYRHGD